MAAVVLVLTASFAWLNLRFLGLPANIALLIMGLAAALLLIGVELLFPGSRAYGAFAGLVRQIDFYEAVMNGMLGFLLFAGALHVDLDQLRDRAAAVGLLATLGVLISMLVVAGGFWAAARLLGLPLGFAWCLVFGALIAPTDPVAVLSTLKHVQVPASLRTDMSGEALFNDGIGVVLFTIAIHAATLEHDGFGPALVGRLLLLEAGGGALLGLTSGFVAYRAMQAIDDYGIEVLISIALVTGTYAAALRLHVSGPIAVVVAGVLMGNRGASRAMSDLTRRYVFGFWTLVDQILNATLFLLIGLEVLVVGFLSMATWLGLAAVPLVVVARLLAVAIPVGMLSRWTRFERGTVASLTWGGIRGGISIALALSIPEGPGRAPILAATYAVVLFTVLVQGLTFERVARWTAAAQGGAAGRGEAGPTSDPQPAAAGRRDGARMRRRGR